MIYTSDKELMDAIADDFKGILEVVGDAIVEELKESMDKEIYDTPEGEWYVRHHDDYGLYGLWERENARKVGKLVSVLIDEHPDKLSISPPNFIHGSKYWPPMEDIRSILSILVIEGKSGPLFGEDGWWRSPRNFWKPVISKIKMGEFNKVIESEFNRYGILYKKG